MKDVRLLFSWDPKPLLLFFFQANKLIPIILSFVSIFPDVQIESILVFFFLNIYLPSFIELFKVKIILKMNISLLIKSLLSKTNHKKIALKYWLHSSYILNFLFLCKKRIWMKLFLFKSSIFRTTSIHIILSHADSTLCVKGANFFARSLNLVYKHW